MESNQKDDFYKKVTNIIRDKIAERQENNQWYYWNRRDFTSNNEQQFPRGRPIVVLTRVATKTKLMKITQGKELNKKTYQRLIDNKILEFKKDINEQIEEYFTNNSDSLPMSKLDELIGGDGLNFNGCLTIRGLSYSSCQRFSKGQKLRTYIMSFKNGKIENFDLNKFLKRLLHLNEDNNYSITDKHSIIINLLEKLKVDLKNKSNDTRKINNVLMSYLVSFEKYEKNIIKKENIEELMERILNYKEPDLFRLLNSLVQDEKLNGKEKILFEKTTHQLKNELKINETEFNEWINEPLAAEELQESEVISQESTKSYLILKIVPSDNKNEQQSKPEYELQAWFLPSIDTGYDSLNWIIKEFEIKEKKNKFSRQKIRLIFTSLINYCVEKLGNSQLIIECFAPNELLSIDIDNWECEVDGNIAQIKREPCIYNVHTRFVSRLEQSYQRRLREWKRRWDELKIEDKNLETQVIKDENLETQVIEDEDFEFYFSQPSTLWVNLCTSTQEKQQELFKKIYYYGIPIAIWSRCYELETSHQKEIDNLINICNNKVKYLPEKVQERRKICPSILTKDPKNLGHHLSLLWDNPYRLPPDSPINHLNE